MVYIVSQAIVLNKNDVGRMAKAGHTSFTWYMIMRDAAMQVHCNTKSLAFAGWIHLTVLGATQTS